MERISLLPGSPGLKWKEEDMQSVDEEQRTPQQQAEYLWGIIQKKLAELSVYLEAHPEVELGLEDEKLNTLH